MPDAPEFLCLFENSNGPVSIEIKVNDNGKSQIMPIAKRKTTWVEAQKLFDSVTGAPFRQMTFDEHLYQVDKYEMFVQRDKIIIHVAQPT